MGDWMAPVCGTGADEVRDGQTAHTASLLADNVPVLCPLAHLSVDGKRNASIMTGSWTLRNEA